MKHGKNYSDSVKAFDLTKTYDAAEAVGIVLETAKAKFDIAVSCVKLLSAHNSTQHTSRKHKV